MTTKILLQSNENQTSAIPSTNEARNGAGELDAAHTPQTWRVDPYSSSLVIADDQSAPSLAERVATAYGDTKDQRAQRARLIAAAPTLYEAASILITNAEFIDDPRTNGATDCYAVSFDDRDALLAALALANGKQESK